MKPEPITLKTRDYTYWPHGNDIWKTLKPDGSHYFTRPKANWCSCPAWKECKHLKDLKEMIELMPWIETVGRIEPPEVKYESQMG